MVFRSCAATLVRCRGRLWCHSISGDRVRLSEIEQRFICKASGTKGALNFIGKRHARLRSPRQLTRNDHRNSRLARGIALAARTLSGGPGTVPLGPPTLPRGIVPYCCEARHLAHPESPT